MEELGTQYYFTIEAVKANAFDEIFPRLPTHQDMKQAVAEADNISVKGVVLLASIPVRNSQVKKLITINV
jgi:hypothetical protein